MKLYNLETKIIETEDFEKIKKKIGLFLKIERIKKGYSILELSEISGVSRTQISKLENAKIIMPTFKIYLQLCFALNIDLFDFISEISESIPFNSTIEEQK